MKKIIRMLIFSAVSLFVVAWFNSGVILPSDLDKLFITIFLIAVIYYIVNPLLKILLLPINIVTLGTASFLAYIVIFITINDYFDLIQFKEWIFPGVNLNFLIIREFTLSPIGNKILSAFFISFIISFLELII